MLVQINTEVGGHSTDVKTRFHNFLCCLHAVATAPANSSPVVNPVNTSGVRSTSNNCITVISNSEGGGWLTGANNNTNANSTYNSANTGSQIIDLYAPSGKTSYPFLRLAFGNFQYAFANAQFGSFSSCEFIAGHSDTSINPAANTLVQDTTFFSGGSTSTGRNQRTMTNAAWTDVNVPLHIGRSGELWTVASTANYLIILGNKEVFYYGLRSVSPWETGVNANPPWVSFSWSSPGTFNYYQAWATTFTANGSSSLNTNRYGIAAQSNSTLFLTCTNDNSSVNPTQNVKNNLLFAATAPLASFSNERTVRWDAPTIDPVSGLASPAATPLVLYLSSSSLGNETVTGVMPGILRGPVTTPAGANNWVTFNDYTISGTDYRTVRQNLPTFCDIWFVRKA